MAPMKLTIQSRSGKAIATLELEPEARPPARCCVAFAVRERRRLCRRRWPSLPHLTAHRPAAADSSGCRKRLWRPPTSPPFPAAVPPPLQTVPPAPHHHHHRRTRPGAHPQATVAALKKKFHAVKRGMYPSRQRFTLPLRAGEKRPAALADDDRTLASYGLASGGVLVFKDLGPQARAPCPPRRRAPRRARFAVAEPRRSCCADSFG